MPIEETADQLYARLGRQVVTIEAQQAEYGRLRQSYSDLFSLVNRIKSGEVAPSQVELSSDDLQSWVLHPAPNLDQPNGQPTDIPQNRLPPE